MVIELFCGCDGEFEMHRLRHHIHKAWLECIWPILKKQGIKHMPNKTIDQELADLVQFQKDQAAAIASQVAINQQQAALITQLQAAPPAGLTPAQQTILDSLDADAVANDPTLTPPAVVTTPPANLPPPTSTTPPAQADGTTPPAAAAAGSGS